jgi:SEC-C motif-containing protein
MGRADFLRATWHPAHCPETLDLDEAPKPQWLGLTLLGSAQTDARHATVTFVARFKRNGRARRLHEISEFVQTPAGWLYVKGVFPDET